MNKKPILIQFHSFVDLITNSSTELYIVDLSKIEGVLKDMFETIKTHHGGETRIHTWESYQYKEDYILPDGTDTTNVYVCWIDQGDDTLMGIIEKFFAPLNFKYKDE
jgi:hypothetical protein